MINSKITACKHASRSEIAKFDNTVLYKCDNCYLIFTDSCRTIINPDELYKNYYGSNEIVGRFNSLIEYVIKLFRFFRAFKMFTIHPKARSILDIGSGRGLMLYYLEKYYKYERAIGTQISKAACEYSKNVLGLEMYDKDILELNLGKESFDIVTLWHVLEHVKEPELYVKKIQTLLKKNGKLVIEVPNFNSWTRKLTGRYWLGLDLKYHLYFFTRNSLSRLLRKYGFTIKAVHTFSLEYSTFISAQSIISRLTRSDQLFFYYLQGNLKAFNKPLHIMMFILLAPICFLINITLYYSKKGEVLLFIAEKAASSPTTAK